MKTNLMMQKVFNWLYYLALGLIFSIGAIAAGQGVTGLAISIALILMLMAMLPLSVDFGNE